jgi:type I restriction enzyme R subunit
VLSPYSTIGVEELEQIKLAPLLQLKYGSNRNVVDILSRPDEIGNVLGGF